MEIAWYQLSTGINDAAKKCIPFKEVSAVKQPKKKQDRVKYALRYKR
jgi:hypothetical protein